MTTKEKIIAEIEKIPEKHLDTLYKLIKDFESIPDKNGKSGRDLMAKLRQIKIQAPPDFSMQVGLYDIDRKDAE